VALQLAHGFRESDATGTHGAGDVVAAGAVYPERALRLVSAL
jgi:hypothetical protein